MFWEWEEMKIAEKWCFSIRKNDKRLLVTVFQQWEKLLIMVFQQRKGKGETSAGRSCFSNENDEKMADWSVLVVVFQHRESAEGLLAMVFQ